MSAQTDMPKSDSSAGLPPRAQSAAPKIDLSAGLIPKKPAPSLVDLTAGLIAREENAAQSAGRSSFANQRGTAKQRPTTDTPASSDASYAPDANAGSQPLPQQASKPLNPLRDVVRRSVAANAESPEEPAAVSTNEPRVLAVDGAPQGTWQPPVSVAEDAPASQFAGQPMRSQPDSKGSAPERTQPMRGREQQAPTVPPPSPAAKRESPVPSEQRWERVENQRGDAQPETPATGLSVHPGETPHNAAARMSGLRNLIESLGLKNQARTPDSVEPMPQALPPIEPVQPRPVHPRTAQPSAQAPTWKNEPSASPTLVTAPPEFLPPKPLVEKSEKEQVAPNNGTSRRDRRETFDDVEILPSWRGQYKRK